MHNLMHHLDYLYLIRLDIYILEFDVTFYVLKEV